MVRVWGAWTPSPTLATPTHTAGGLPPGVLIRGKTTANRHASRRKTATRRAGQTKRKIRRSRPGGLNKPRRRKRPGFSNGGVKALHPPSLSGFSIHRCWLGTHRRVVEQARKQPHGRRRRWARPKRRRWRRRRGRWGRRCAAQAVPQRADHQAPQRSGRADQRRQGRRVPHRHQGGKRRP